MRKTTNIEEFCNLIITIKAALTIDSPLIFIKSLHHAERSNLAQKRNAKRMCTN